MNHYTKYIGLLNTIFWTMSALYIENSIKIEPAHYYSEEYIEMNSKFHIDFNFLKPQNYNDNILKLNTLNEQYNTIQYL